MGTSTLAELPPMPPETAGRWLEMKCEGPEMVGRWLRVMHAMDKRYWRDGIISFNRSFSHRPSRLGAAYYYWTEDGEVVLRMTYLPQSRQHLVQSVGFVGAISPQVALDLVVERAIGYLRERQLIACLAFVPKRMDNPNILKLYDLALSHPRIRVTVKHETQYLRQWNVEAVELQAK